jgi:hypothetical protein
LFKSFSTPPNGILFMLLSGGNFRSGHNIPIKPNFKLNSSKTWTKSSNLTNSNTRALTHCSVVSDPKQSMDKKLLSRLIKHTRLSAADIALKNGIPHYLLVSSIGADEKSWFLYPRTKGEVERDLRAKKLPLLTIFRPGLL